jgi:hypothetical protein
MFFLTRLGTVSGGKSDFAGKRTARSKTNPPIVGSQHMG